jgi:ubiquitin carboxyl-terminal hydrolase 7
MEIFVPRNGTIGDAIAILSQKLKLDEKTSQLIRIYEVHTGKIHKELIEDFNVVGMNEFTTYYAEKVPEDETTATEDDRAIYCFHFDKEPSKPHGVPFKFVIKPNEKFKETRERLSKRTGIKGKMLQQIKFAVVPRGLYPKPRYLEDTDVLMEITLDGDDMLGLDHVNKTRNFWGKTENMFIK